VKSTYAMGNRYAPSVGVLSAYPLLLLRETNVFRTVNLQCPTGASLQTLGPNPRLRVEIRVVARRIGYRLGVAEPTDEGLKERLSRQGEEALGKVAEELVANPVINAALAGAFEAREKAVQAQEAAMGALGIPSAADIERLTRRLRSVSQRLEGIEDAVDRLDERIASAGSRAGGADLGELADRLDARLDELARDLSAVREVVAPGDELPPRAQERLTVSDSPTA
jgi:HEPN domain-containing protein